MPHARIVVAAMACVGLTLGTATEGQVAKDARSVREAYGARLDLPDPAMNPANERRVVTRLNNRLNSRLSTRIERYRLPGKDPAQALAGPTDDGSRTATAPVTPRAQPSEDPQD